MKQKGSMYAVAVLLLAAFVWTSYQVKRSEMATSGSGGKFSVSTSTGSAPPLTKHPAPGFTLPSLSGGEVSIADFQGASVVLLDFSSISYPMCRAAMPRLAELEQKYGSSGLKVITVNWGDDAALVSKFVKETGYKPLILLDDGSVREEYHVVAMPTIVIVDKAGSVSSVRIGRGGEQYRWIEAEICKLLGLKYSPPTADNKTQGVIRLGEHH
jgi:peroxiredoxin